MSVFDLAAIFISLVAVVGWVNAKWLRLPQSVAMLAVGGLGSLLLIAGRSLPLGAAQTADSVSQIIGKVNFPETVVGYMLGFLLFAGAMQVDLSELRRRRLAVWSLATFGVLVSTAIVGLGTWLVARALSLPLDLPWAIVFGALISPTDPVAVLTTVAHRRVVAVRCRRRCRARRCSTTGSASWCSSTALAFAAGGP